MWRRYLRFWGSNPPADLDAELTHHLEELTRKLIEEGRSPHDAREEARRRFGDLRHVRGECLVIDRRWEQQKRWSRLLDDMWQDLRLGARILTRSPGFAVVATLTLALGIGAATAIFTVADGVLFRPLPYRDPDRLVSIVANGEGIFGGFPPQIDFTQARRQHSGFDGVVDLRPSFGGTLVDAGEAARVTVYGLSEGFLQTFGIEPILGRDFVAEDHRPGGENVVLLRHAFWRAQFDGDPGVIGRTVRMEGVEARTFEIIGVLPRGFTKPDSNPPAPFFAPLVENPDDDLNPRMRRSPIARLKPGVTREQAEAEMRTLVAGLTAEHPEILPDRTVRLVPLQQRLFGRVRLTLQSLLGAAGLVLCIACANLASLMLARGVGRDRELAVRAAVGADRRRLSRQLLVESFTVALPGGLLGVVAGYWLFALLSARIPIGATGNLLRLLPAGLDMRVMGFAIGATGLSTLLFGLVPASRLSNPAVHDTLRATTRSSARRSGMLRNLDAMVIALVALSLVVLTGAALLLHNFARLVAPDLGFRTAGVEQMFVDMPRSRYPMGPARLAVYRDLRSRLESVSGVTTVAGISSSPVYTIGGALYVDGERAPSGEVFNVTPGYFEVLRVPLLGGRDFSDREAFESGAVAIVDERAANLLWPDEEPLGQHYVDGDGRAFEVVGLVADTKRSFTRELESTVYLPLSARPERVDPDLLVRSDSDLDVLRPALQAAVRGLDPRLVATVRPLEAAFDLELAEPSFRALFFGVFAAVALVLACIGIYGVVNHSVGGRTREIGIRMALGAEAGTLRRMVRLEMFPSVALGLICGAVGAFWATRLLTSMLSEVTPHDPITFGGTAAVLALTALAAAYGPALRASRVDPMVALRAE
jgi:predicted permease